MSAAFSTTWLFVRIRPERSITNPVPVAARRVISSSSRGSRSGAGGWPKKRRKNSSPPNSFPPLCGFSCRVQMVTTIAVCASAISRNVVAVRLPEMGALFDAGVRSDCAADGGDRLKRDAITIPNAIAATAISSAETNVVLDLGIGISSGGASAPRPRPRFGPPPLRRDPARVPPAGAGTGRPASPAARFRPAAGR